MPHAYCTFFDSGYLSRGLAMIESLRANGDDAPVWIMALDDLVPDQIAEMELPGVEVIRVDALEAANPQLVPLKAQRSRMEYYFTTTAFLIGYVMDHSEPGTSVAYLDADLFFFASPSLFWDALGDDSIGIVPHRYPERLERGLAKYGTYNAGVIAFRDDPRGRACLEWWAAAGVEWCSDTPVDGKYANQGYLDRFAERFEGVQVLEPAGINAAPWNSGRFRWSEQDGQVFVGDDPLVFFHFHGLRRTGGWWVTAQLMYRAPMGSVLRNRVYRPYAAALDRWDARIGIAAQIAHRGVGLRAVAFRVAKSLLNAVSILSGNAVRVG